MALAVTWHPSNTTDRMTIAPTSTPPVSSYFQAATGQFPFSGEHKEIQKKKVSGEVEEIEKSPEVLRPFFNKALHQELSERHKSADEMYDELNCILQDEVYQTGFAAD